MKRILAAIMVAGCMIVTLALLASVDNNPTHKDLRPVAQKRIPDAWKDGIVCLRPQTRGAGVWEVVECHPTTEGDTNA